MYYLLLAVHVQQSRVGDSWSNSLVLKTE